jgi:D-alanyl-D-alanine carboxypeptidase (penicillin-binding protein 5/6)
MNFPKQFGLVLGICLAVWLAAASVAAPAEPAEDEFEVSARSFVIMEAKTGKILLALNPQLFMPPASTLKIMTAMSVAEHLRMDDKVPVSPYAASAPASKIDIKPGEEYTVRELLYALLLSSANDGARALAEKVSGSEEAFARQMTQEVRQWGAYRTTLATANGLPAENQFSTAEDLAKMFKRAMENPELARIMSTKFYTIQGDRELRNHNRFLWTTPLAVGGKTGYTRASKHTYVGMFQKEKLFFAKRHTGKSTSYARRSKKARQTKVVMGSAGSVPAKKKATVKKKARSRNSQDDS